MTLNAFLDWMDAVRPSPWSHEQKTAWVNDLESALWGQILLAPMGRWKSKTAAEDGEKPLLLPDGWRKLYAAYLGAMMDFAAGEYNQYANSMALYNGHLAELGAWYAERFDPARRPPMWLKLPAVTGGALEDGAVYLGSLPAGTAVLAAECRVTDAFDAEGQLALGSGEEPTLYLAAAAEVIGPTHRLTLNLPPEDRDLYLTAPEGVTQGRVELRLLIQPGMECALAPAASALQSGASSSGGISAGGIGSDGESAYEIAVANGFKGTEEEWLESLAGVCVEEIHLYKDGVTGEEGGGFGVGIASVEQTTTSTEDGGTNVITVTLTDGTASTFSVRNGSKGADGADGADGAVGTGGAMYITLTVNPSSDVIYNSDKTISEIYAAHQAGTALYCLAPFSGETKILSLREISDSTCVFSGVQEQTEYSATFISGSYTSFTLDIVQMSGTGTGEDGVGIASVEQTTTSTADGGTNVITVTLTDGTASAFTVKNGSKGADGSGGAMYVVLTVNPSSDVIYNSDKTISEIYAAYQAGTALYCLAPFSGETKILSLREISDSTCVFSGVQEQTEYSATFISGSNTSFTLDTVQLSGAGTSGADGADGEDGVGIASVEQTTTSTADGGTNVITVTLTDDTTSTFAVKNGSKGSTGAAGAKGADGVSCTHSWDGTTLTVTSASGTSSADLKGDKGDKGDTGPTGGGNSTVSSAEPPTYTAAAYAVGDFWFDSSAGSLYICTEVSTVGDSTVVYKPVWTKLI